ncbi:hypothetical protein EB796_021503 [Bugula neritina]|uniref:G-protein coupled receptors family 1 profile domain-containing protein n=1 Tax=Bugula neritina TaxID=10212 RepID=A0A7J7J282_BUGNE|nr:hypothetical protein EB796_021503 [Bugula neritina]
MMVNVSGAPTMPPLLNQTFNFITAAAEEHATYAWEETHYKRTRRLIYYLLHGFVGLVTSVFNGLVILVYIRRANIRKHISLLMLSMFVFCLLHGLIVGIVYPLQRVYRYVMDEKMCVLSTLVMDLADKYVMLLLPLLAVERLIYLKCPFIDQKKVKRLAIASISILLVVAMLYSWLPLIPQINVPEEEYIYSNNTARQEYLVRFYKYYTCQGKLNKKNFLEPIFTILVSSLSVIVVVGAYIWMYKIARDRLTAFASITVKKQKRLKKAAFTVFYVALTFILTMMPFGIVIQIQALCKADTTLQNNSFCNGITLELRFCFSIIAHLGNLLAPMLFSWLSPNIRQIINAYYRQLLPSCKLLPRFSTKEKKQEIKAASPTPRVTQRVHIVQIHK